MKTQFEQCLKKARLNENKFDGDATYASIDQFLSGKMPWQRAAALKAEKLAARVASSVSTAAINPYQALTADL